MKKLAAFFVQFFFRIWSPGKVYQCLAVLFFSISFQTLCAQQVIGLFPEMDGGFETTGVAQTSLTAIAASNQLVVWTGGHNATNSVPAIESDTVRTGTRSLQWTTTSASNLLFSRSANSTAIQNSTSYVVQFYWFKGYSGSARSLNVAIGPGGTTNISGAINTGVLGVSAASTDWTKATVVITSGSVATSPRYGLVRFSPQGGSFSTSPGYLFDDFVVYPGSAADNTPPGDVDNPQITGFSGSSIDLSWTAPAGGIDNGGYMVVRYPADPAGQPSPNPNGIYSTGNSIGSGTIVYIGTNTSFSNTGLSSNTAYYYRIYAVDKAFNYSASPQVIAGFTGIASPTGITFTTPSGCITSELTLSWTGPLNYDPSNNTLIAFLKAGSAVTAGTPNLAASAYTAGTVFGSGTAYQNDAAAYCIYNGSGTSSGGDHSGLTLTGLSPNTTYHLLLFNVVDGSNTYSAGATGNGTTLNSVAEPANHAGSFATGAITTSNIPLTWAAAGGSPAPLGYLLQASSASTPADPADFTDPADQLNIGSGSANVKTGGTAYSAFSGYAPGTMYYFRLSSYTNSASCIDFKAGGPSLNAATLPNAVTSPAFDITGGTGSINWVAATGYNTSNHSTLVFVSASPITVNTPTINPAGYSANSGFGLGTAYQWDANARCVYSGDGTSATVTGLAAGFTYYVLILTVVDAANYNATHSYSAYTTISATYTATGEYTWNGGATGAWTIAANWTPNRTTPATTDVLIFNTAGNVTVTSVPTETIAKLSVNNGNVTLQSSTPVTISFTDNNGAANTDLIITAGNSLTSGSAVSILLNSNASALVSGTLTINSGTSFNTNSSGALSTVNGRINCSGTLTSTAAARLVVNGGGIYNHAVNGGTIPTATWNTNSTCLVSGITSAGSFSGHRQTFSKFIWDCAGMTVTHFVLGANSSNTAPSMIITDSFIVRRTNGKILQISSSGGQRDFTCGNYFQYGGIAAVTYNTDAGGEQRSLTVNNTFYVTDSLESNTIFQIINNPGGTNNIVGRLFVKGNVEMHPTLSASTLESKKDNPANPSIAEIHFTGNSAQQARFSTISGNVDFVTNHTGSGVTLASNANAYRFKLLQGVFYIAANTLTINDAVSYPAPGTGTIGGSALSNLTITDTAGTLNFFAGARILKDFTLTANATANLGTELGITAGSNPGRDSLGSGAVLTTNDNLILRSDALGTARQAIVPTDGSGNPLATIIGKVAVERYLPMGLSSDARRWRLLTAPFRSINAPTINAAWQAGASNPDRLNPGAYDPRPGYGTHITRNNVWNASDGYDHGSTANPSIYYYSNSTNSWMVPANTNSVKITDNSGVYMLFARGDRSIVVSTTTIAAKPTTLDPRGELNLGRVTVPLVSSGYQTVGNPYASQIKLDNISFNDTPGRSKTIYLWDPKQLGSFNVGKFVTCSGDGNIPATYTYTGNTSTYESAPGVIESSGAFVVIGNGGNIVFNESDKRFSSTSIGIASRPVMPSSGNLGLIRKLYVDMSVIKNGETLLADGAAITWNPHYDNDHDYLDAQKLSAFNTREEIAILSNEQRYAVERRKNLQERDTIHLDIQRLNNSTYTFRFRPEQLDDKLVPWLEDRYMRTLTPLSTSHPVEYRFSITDDPASAANNRFYIIFRRAKKKWLPDEEAVPVTVVPNPVQNGMIGLSIPGWEAGPLQATLYSNNGQVLYSGRIMHNGTEGLQTLSTGLRQYKGMARLELVAANGSTRSVQIMMD